jgi:hypothetical protein
MEATKKQMQSFYKRLDKAQGETDIQPILEEMNQFINTLPTTEQDWAKEDFKYYFTKRFVHLEDEIERLQYDIYKDRQAA